MAELQVCLVKATKPHYGILYECNIFNTNFTQPSKPSRTIGGTLQYEYYSIVKTLCPLHVTKSKIPWRRITVSLFDAVHTRDLSNPQFTALRP